ncbi:SurA N-terminal domain-containing protein [Lentzea nigeriaca]|uniref:hypothetical protein n=1 Tax=Lentzea nigeriaca TaxID=1128665 RepID=UPI00195A89DD|nr:hypothetical protein [Lentzea nigeriaca]MBM7858378.1 hypothetical protein [Lentzea nigeriaca]
MSTVLKRFSLVGVAVALLAATGCGTGPNQPGVAVIVGSESISLDTVQQRVNAMLKEKPNARQQLEQGKLDLTSRDIVTEELTRKLVRIAAEREGVSVGEDAIEKVIDRAGGVDTLVREPQVYHTRETVRDWVHDVLLRVELGKRFVNKLNIEIDFFYAKDRKEAEAAAKEIAADPAKMKEHLQAAPPDSSGQPTASSDVKLRASEQAAELLTTPVFGAQEGSVVAFGLQGANSNWVVAQVKKRGMVASAPDTDGTSKVTADFGLRMALFLTSDVPVTVSPRYGLWDPVAMRVIPTSERGTNGFILAPKPQNKS